MRPGPIQGDMVHPVPAPQTRRGSSPTIRPSSSTSSSALWRRPPVPGTVMQAGDHAAGAPGRPPTRCLMAAWKRQEVWLRTRSVVACRCMPSALYSSEQYAECLVRDQGLRHYGFRKAMPRSFALITYASCWLKCQWNLRSAPSALRSTVSRWPGCLRPDPAEMPGVTASACCRSTCAAAIGIARRNSIKAIRRQHHRSGWPADGQRCFRRTSRTSSVALDGPERSRMSPTRTRRSGLDRRHRALLADAGALRDWQAIATAPLGAIRRRSLIAAVRWRTQNGGWIDFRFRCLRRVRIC